MKTYNISKSVKLLPIVLLSLGLIAFSVVAIKIGYRMPATKVFLVVGTAVFIITGLWYYMSNRLEKIIIDENRLIYKKMFKSQLIMWEDVKEVSSLDRWSTAPVIVLKGEGINFEIDYHRFSNAKGLAKDILSHLKHIPLKKRYEFTEI